jgi:ABC-type sugar transport system ATPase subunit
VNGRTVAFRHPGDAVEAGVALVPEDRRKDGLLLNRSIAENGAMAILSHISNRGFLRPGAETQATASTLLSLKTAMRCADQAVGELSGGNQQKVVLSKWLLTKPRLLILDEPTRGVDVGAKAEVHRLIRELAHEGMAVLLISSDLPEVIQMADRVGVMRAGALVATLTGSDISEARIMMEATGG